MSYYNSTNQPPTFLNSTHNEYSTQIVGSPIVNFDNTQSLVILPNCNAEIRCAYWLGALNGVTNIGCGINVLRFISEIDESNAQAGLQQAITGQGTPFSVIVDWFNKKIYNSGLYIHNYEMYQIHETRLDINSKNNLAIYFNILNTYLPLNSCTIVKLNRNDNPLLRPVNTTPGHYVLISKDMTGNLWTYEPILSVSGNCNKRKFNGTVSDNFFSAYQNEGYISASLLAITRFVGRGGGENTENISENEKQFLMPQNTIDEFITDIKGSIECKKSGGKTKKKRRNKKRLNNKNKKSYKKYKYLRK